MGMVISLALMLGIVLLPIATTETPGVETRFQIQLATSTIDRSLRPDFWELDLHNAAPDDISWMRANSIIPVCYFSAGTWEKWREDASEYPAELVGNSWSEWPGERYVDVRQIDQLALILEKRLDLCAAKGFLAVDPDNIDSWGAPTGFPLSESHALGFTKWLANAAHERGLLIAQKNASELTLQLADTFDFAVTEDCAADKWCQTMQPYIDNGKPIFAVEYTDRTSAEAFAAFCREPELADVSLLLTDRELTGVVRWCN